MGRDVLGILVFSGLLAIHGAHAMSAYVLLTSSPDGVYALVNTSDPSNMTLCVDPGWCVDDMDFNLTHSYLISGLDANQTYSLTIRLWNQENGTLDIGPYNFTTEASYAPIIETEEIVPLINDTAEEQSEEGEQPSPPNNPEYIESDTSPAIMMNPVCDGTQSGMQALADNMRPIAGILVALIVIGLLWAVTTDALEYADISKVLVVFVVGSGAFIVVGMIFSLLSVMGTAVCP